MGHGVMEAGKMLARESARDADESARDADESERDADTVRRRQPTTARPEVRGKFLWVGGERLYVKGPTYGAFEPDETGNEYHRHELIERDFSLMAENGMNAVRIPHTMPPVTLLDAAQRHGLHVMVGLSAEQYVGYLVDRKGAPDIGAEIRRKVREVAGHPAILCYALGNEIQAPMARWLGRRKVERYLEDLYGCVKDEDPDGIVTYVNYPSTEYLELPFLDVLAFNVYLEQQDRLEAYLARLHNLAGDRPLLMSELGLDAMRNGEEAQAEALEWQLRTTFGAGCAGAFVFSWTDEWFRAGEYVDDWAFGLTDEDRIPKPALASVRDALVGLPFPDEQEWPSISAVVCTYNGSRTLRAALEGLAAVDYQDLEIIVVDDGSTDDSARIASDLADVVISTENAGLSSARNTGAAAASGEIIAYVDDDAVPDPKWALHLADTFTRTTYAAVGGPNVPVPNDGLVAEAVAHSPGGPIHVLVSDTEAEHIPGCNLAVRKDVFDAIGGFDPQFRAAGDDVDFCWRLEEAGYRIGFNPAAAVMHHRRNKVRGYWKQQRGYGRAEALLERKWPERYNAAGHVSWGGRVYGNGFARLMGFRRSRVYSGVWGFAPFQSLYAGSTSVVDWLARLPELYLVIAFLAGLSVLGLLWTPLLFAVPILLLAMLLPMVDAAYSAVTTRFSARSGTRRMRLIAVTAVLHVMQPVARLVGRLGYGLSPWRIRAPSGLALPWPKTSAVWCESWRSPEDRLADVDAAVKQSGLAVREGGDFDRWEIEVRAGMLGAARTLFVAEDHGAGNQYLRFRIWPRTARVAMVAAGSFLALAAAAFVDGSLVVAALLGLGGIVIAAGILLECAVAVAVLRAAAALAETAPAQSVWVEDELLERAHEAAAAAPFARKPEHIGG